MKHPFAALLLAAATSVLALVGCADDESNPTPAADALVLHVGYENAVGEPFDQGCRKWQELVNQRSHGKMQLKLYPLSTLGSKSEIMDRMVAGEPVSTLTDGAFFYDRGIYDMGIVFTVLGTKIKLRSSKNKLTSRSLLLTGAMVHAIL